MTRRGEERGRGGERNGVVAWQPQLREFEKQQQNRLQNGLEAPGPKQKGKIEAGEGTYIRGLCVRRKGSGEPTAGERWGAVNCSPLRTPAWEEAEGMGLDKKRWRPSPGCLGHLSFLVYIINQRGLQSYKRPGAFHMFTFTNVQLLRQRGCEAGRWGCRGKLTSLKKKKKNLQGTMGSVVWVPGKAKHILPLVLATCLHDGAPSSPGGTFQISKSAFEALWAWEVGYVWQTVNRPPLPQWAQTRKATHNHCCDRVLAPAPFYG